jgi:phosphate transport system protein
VAQADLTLIDQQVLQLFAMVSEGLSAATEAFLSGDREAGRVLVASDETIDSLQCETEDLVHQELAAAIRADSHVRHLVSTLQIVPELERSGDLVEHIALRIPQGLASQISGRARGYIEAMGKLGVEMWQLAADAYADRDPTVAARLRLMDDELDDLHVCLSEELATSAAPTAVAIEMGLIARFYERLGDHAANIARRIQQGAGVQPPQAVAG